MLSQMVPKNFSTHQISESGDFVTVFLMFWSNAPLMVDQHCPFSWSAIEFESKWFSSLFCQQKMGHLEGFVFAHAMTVAGDSLVHIDMKCSHLYTTLTCPHHDSLVDSGRELTCPWWQCTWFQMATMWRVSPRDGQPHSNCPDSRAGGGWLVKTWRNCKGDAFLCEDACSTISPLCSITQLWQFVRFSRLHGLNEGGIGRFAFAHFMRWDAWEQRGRVRIGSRSWNLTLLGQLQVAARKLAQHGPFFQEHTWVGVNVIFVRFSYMEGFVFSAVGFSWPGSK